MGSPDALRFDNRVVIITGAGRGIGRAHALTFASRGAAVIVNDPGVEPDGSGGDRAPAERVAEEIRTAGGTAVVSLASVASEAGAHSIIDLAMERFGRIDALVNNAGIQVRQRIESVDEADFRRHLDIHLLGAYWLTRAAWPQLADASGRVVNTVSALLFGMEGYAAYTAAKGGILGLTRALAVEGRERGIGVNCVSPGAATRLMTGPATGVPPNIAAQLEAALPAAAVAEVVAYLAHPACTLQGECISVAGNHVSRYLLAETAGVRLEALTAEAFRDAVGEVLDPSRLSIWKDTAALTQASQASVQLSSLPQTGRPPHNVEARCPSGVR